MHVLSVNIGRVEPLADAKASGVTGIFKRPVGEPVSITSHGLIGDAICDIENHGGVDQAVYLFGAPDYLWWARELEYDLAPGTFGENLTVSDLESALLLIGDRFHIGSVILEVTAPRIPCVTLARRMDEPTFLKRFREAERPGVYCRVVQEGLLQAGSDVHLEHYTGSPVSALEIFRDFFAPEHDAATIRRHLAVPIAIRARRDKERQLSALLAQSGAVYAP